MQEGRSKAYAGLIRNRKFLKSLKAFLFLLRFLQTTKDLLLYKQYHYEKRGKMSCVFISGSNLQTKLLFRENEHGTGIIINDLI